MSGLGNTSPFATSRHALLVACALFGFAHSLAAEEATLRIGGTGSTLGTMRLLGAAFEKTHPNVTVNILPSLGSTGGIRAAISGAVDIGVSSRPLSEAERGQGAKAVEYGRSPLVFAVAKATRTTEVTTAQLVDIYSGKLAAWPGGDRIRVVMRPVGDTNTMKLKDMSPQIRDAVTAAEMRPGMLFALTDQASIEQLEKIPGALILTSLTELLTSAPWAKALKLDGIEPSPASLADGSYPLFLSYFLVIDKTPSALGAQFIDFTQSEPARKILAQTGYWVPSLNPAR